MSFVKTLPILVWQLLETKYRSELYLQRDKIYQSFQNFLKSDKRCFVLIGKSGVGKSNFLLSLEEDFSSKSNFGLLIYDSNQFKKDRSITKTISHDFNSRLISYNKIQEIWHEIAKLQEIEEKCIILCIDALNENSSAKELLEELNELL